MASKNLSSSVKQDSTHAKEQKTVEPAKHKNIFLHIYDVHYKKFLVFSLTLLLITIIINGVFFIQNSELFPRGVSLKGGVSLTVHKIVDSNEIQSFVQDSFPESDVRVTSMSSFGGQTGIIIEASDVTSDDLLSKIQEKIGFLQKDEYIIETTGSALGESFFKQAIIAVLVSFLFMAIVVYLYFKDIIPSSFVILAAFSDIMGPLAVINILNIKLSTAGVAAFLMLIGYSVDTDILLTTRVFRSRKGSVFDRTVDAMKTGVTMTLTSLSATFIAFLVTNSSALKEIMMILSIGLVFDLIYTWFQNATILRWHVENLDKKGKPRRWFD